MRTDIHFRSYLVQFSLECKIFQALSCRENQNTHFMFNNLSLFFFFENRAVYEIMWKNIVERGRPQMII